MDRRACRIEHPRVDIERARTGAGIRCRARRPSSMRVFSEVPLPSSTRVSAPDADGDLGRPRTQDLRLGAGRIVLRQPGDLVEQVAAHRIVEPLGRQRLRCLSQPVPHISAQRPGRRVGGQVVGQREGHDDPFSGISSTRASLDHDEMAVGNVLPVGIVVVWFTGQRHAVVSTQHRQGVAPRGGAQLRSVGRQDVQSCIGVGGGRPRRPCRRARRAHARRSALPAPRCRRWTPRADDGGSTARSTTPLWDSSHCPSVNGADADWLDRHADAGRTHRRDNAIAAQRGRHRGERRVAPQWCGATPPAHHAFVEKPDTPAVGVHQTVLLPARGIRLHQQTRRRFENQRRDRSPAHRASRDVGTSGVPGQAHTRKDLPPDRVVPVAEARPKDARRRPPTSRRAAPCSRRPQNRRRTAANTGRRSSA